MTSQFRIAAIGDSITAGTPYWDPDPAVRERIGDALDVEHQWPYWVQRSHARATIANFGVDLERTDQIRARLAPALTGYDMIIVQGGINDVVQGRDVAETVADLAGMVREAKRAAGAVAIVNLLPWNNGGPEHAGAIERLNEQIAALASAEGVALIDFHAALEDPEQPGRMPDRMTSDGNHPSAEGHRILAEAVTRVVAAADAG